MIEVLYFDGCPHHAPTLALAREVVAELGLVAEIREVRIETPEQANQTRFLGSPSVRVNGKDIEPEARDSEDFAFGCRVYRESGVPPRGLLIDAIREAGWLAPRGLEEVKRAWATHYAGLDQEQIDRRVLGFAALVRGIAREGVVSSEAFASRFDIDESRAKDLFAGLAALGVQFDEQGNVVGAALTTRQTPHRIRVGGKELYAWCALDTLFIPGLLGEKAEVESSCPVSDESIRIGVAPSGVEEFSPPGAVISVVLPGGGSSPALTGPASPT